MACQWSGVAIVTASIDLSSSSRRKSFSVRGALPVIFCDGFDGLCEHGVVDVADGHDLGARIGGEELCMIASAVAQADHGDPDPLAGSGPARAARKHD